VSYLEDRLRRLERKLVWQPSIDEYLDASNRERTRALAMLTERLKKHGLEGPGDRRGVGKAQGIDKTQEVEGARERLLAKFEARTG
jgi:hypothetical protein